MVSWQLWAILGIGFFILEILTPGFLFACFGVGAFAASAIALLYHGLWLQLLVFALVSMAFFFKLKNVYSRFLKPHSHPRMNADALVGKTGRVTERIVPSLDQGRVIVDGEDWWVSSRTGEEVEVGEQVIVVEVQSAKLIVIKE